MRGEPGIGKSCVVSAVCRYMLQRPTSFPIDFFAWLPQRKELVAEQGDLYKNISKILDIIFNNVNKTTSYRADYQVCWEAVVANVTNLRVRLVIDLRGYQNGTGNVAFESFLVDLLSVAKVKVILITSEVDSNNSINHEQREESVTIKPLDFQSTALLFGFYSRFVTKRSDRAVWTPNAFASHLASRPVVRGNVGRIVSQNHGKELYTSLGMGLPSKIRSYALNMSEKEFHALLNGCFPSS